MKARILFWIGQRRRQRCGSQNRERVRRKMEKNRQTTDHRRMADNRRVAGSQFLMRKQVPEKPLRCLWESGCGSCTGTRPWRLSV